MENENLNSNESTEEVVNLENEQVNTSTESVNEETTTSQEKDGKPVQTPEENAAYANIRRESQAQAKQEAQKTIDNEYSRLYGESHGIHSQVEFETALAQQEEQQRIQDESEKYNASPELIERLQKAEEKLNGYESEKQARTQEENVKAIDTEVEGILAIAKTDGVDITKEQLVKFALDEGIMDLKKAYKLFKPEVDSKTLKENAIKEYIEGRRTGKIPVEGSGNTPVGATESPKNMNDALKGAREMLRASKLFNN